MVDTHLRILVLADSARECDSLLADHDSHTASSSAEADSLLESGGFDLVLMALEDESAISKVPKNASKTALVVFSSQSSESFRSRAYQAGACAFLKSPLQADQLEAVLAGLAVLSEPAYDAQTALNNMGMVEIVDEIIKVFLTEAPKLMDEIRAAKASGELSLLARSTHRFAGGIVVFGNIPCVRAARALETAAEAEGGNVDRWYVLLEQSYDRLYATLATK